jgi:subfamily B ATP-binding cassette protein MsbA
VALVGASGAGKSTILNLIPRFFDPKSGDILIDGQSIHGVALKSLRQNIGLVTQEVAIFNDSILGNISYGTPNATLEEIQQAAKDASADAFIMDSEKGYETAVGEDGFSLSGGQRQRIAIARAMLKNAPILLLDEATSSLDTQSENNIQEALRRLMKGRTSLIVAHRLSTIQDADIIHVLDKGQVVETGTHETLLEKQGDYANLYKMQKQA